MVPLLQPKRKTYEEFFEESRNKIPTLTKEWTDFNTSDPGITLLQLFAWLFEMQGEYANYIGEVHQEKYLKLLGYTPNKQQPARGKVTLYGLNKDLKIPMGTKFHAKDVVFETVNTEYLRANKLLNITRCNKVSEDGKEELENLTEVIAYLDGGYERLFTEETNSCFYLGFEKKIDLRVPLRIYFTVYNSKYQRNPLGSLKFAMGIMKWEAYTSEGWQTLKANDHTVGFLKEGYIKLRGKEATVASKLQGQEEEYHYIRCTLLKNHYDVLPQVDYIGINCVNVVQQDTKVVNLCFSSNNQVEQRFPLKHYLALDGKILVLIKQETNTWELLSEEEGDLQYTILRDKSNVPILLLKGKVPTMVKDNIRVICYDKDFYNKCVIGTFGMAIHPKFQIQEEAIYDKALSLDCIRMHKGKTSFEHYHQVACLNEGDENAPIYTFDGKGTIQFGDKTHGKLPLEKGVQLQITGFATTKGERGNVKARMTTQVDDLAKSMGEGIQVINYEDIKGGKDKEDLTEALLHFRKAFKASNRGVTTYDYEQLVKQTPGLLIHKVKVIPGGITTWEQGQNWHKVAIIVKPHSEEQRPKLSDVYKDTIEKHLEPYRLLGTELDILSPHYLGVDVEVCIYKRKGYATKTLEVALKKIVMAAVDSLEGERRFGDPISYGQLFGELDSLEGIEYVEELRLIPIGEEAKQSLAGDIMTKQNVLTYLRNYHMELR